MTFVDIEVFKYDIVVGFKKNGKYEFFWNKHALEPLRKLHDSQEEVVTYNGLHYDLPLIYNYYFNPQNTATPFELSGFIIEQHYKLRYPKDFWNSIDLFFLLQNKLSLKVIEALLGLEIRESSIDFKYPYKLTDPQRQEVEHYNKQDLDATEALYFKMENHIKLRLRLAEYLNIPHDFSIPVPTLMGMGLGAHRVPQSPKEIHEKVLTVPIHHEIKDILLNQMKHPSSNFKTDFTIEGKTFTIANGGLHSTEKQVDAYNVYHVDIKGYYSLLQIDFDLFSRNIPEEGKAKYTFMYNDRLRLKDTGTPDNLLTADSLKIGVLAVWGATRNYHHILYDRYVGTLIPLYGEMFLIHLIELFLVNGIDIYNANTDGLIVSGELSKIKRLVKHWQQHHNFPVEIDSYKRFVQKDVNNYIIGNSLDSLKVKGRDFTALRNWLFANIIVVPQNPVIAKLLAELLFYGHDIDDPEVYVRSRIRNFEPRDYMSIIYHTMKFDGIRYVGTQEPLQRSNRVYASPTGQSVVKYRGDNEFKYPGLPPVKTYNGDMSKVSMSDLDLDYEWYVDEILRKYVTYYG